jgi:hypothetical protein
MKNLIIAFICFLSLQGGLAKATNDSKLKITTQVGDIFSLITLEKKSNEFYIEHQDSRSKVKNHKISKENYDFLVKEFKALKNPPKLSADCYRSKVEISFFKNNKIESQKSSCVYMKTITSEAYESFLLKAQILR